MATLDDVRRCARSVLDGGPAGAWDADKLARIALLLCDEIDAREAVTLAVREARWSTQHMDDPSERMDIIRKAASGPREKLAAARRAREEMEL